MKKLLFLLACCVFYSSTSFAVCKGVSCYDETINAMEVDVNGTVWVDTSGAESNLKCTPQSKIYLKLDASTEGGKIVYSTLLAHQIANKEIKIGVAQDSNPCAITYVNTK